MDNFDLKKYLAEGKLLKEDMSLEFYDGDVELITDSGDYNAEIEDNGKVSFSVVYEDEDDREGMEFDEYNWKDLLGSKHAFVEIASKIPTEVEAIDDYVMITVDLEDLKTLSENKLKDNQELAEDYSKGNELEVVDTDNRDSQHTVLHLSNGDYVEVNVVDLYQNMKDNQ